MKETRKIRGDKKNKDVAQPEAIHLGLSETGAAVVQDIVFENKLAPFTGQAVSANLGSMRESRATVAEGEFNIYEINVPAGSTLLTASLSEVSDPAADLDLYLIYCIKPPSKAGREMMETAAKRISVSYGANEALSF